MPNVSKENKMTPEKYFNQPNNIYDLIAIVEGKVDNSYANKDQKYAVQCTHCESENIVNGNSNFIKLCEYCRTYYDLNTHKQYAYNEIPNTISNYDKIVKNIGNAVEKYKSSIPVEFTSEQITRIKNGVKVYDENILGSDESVDEPVVPEPTPKKSTKFSIDNFLGNVANNIQQANEVAQKETTSKSDQAKKRKDNVKKLIDEMIQIFYSVMMQHQINLVQPQINLVQPQFNLVQRWINLITVKYQHMK